MAPLALVLAVLLCPAPSRAENARSQAEDAAVVPRGGDDPSIRENAARPFDGGNASESVVAGRGASGAARLAKTTPVVQPVRTEPPSAGDKGDPPSKLTTGLIMGGAAVLGGLQGFFTAGVLGAVAGAGLGLAAAWLFHKKDYGGAFGVTAGTIIGSALGGPIGGLIGAVVGGLIGHLLGKLFL